MLQRPLCRRPVYKRGTLAPSPTKNRPSHAPHPPLIAQHPLQEPTKLKGCFASAICLLPSAAMKTLVVLVLALVTVPSAFCDIQDPPSNDNGPTRKLGRGIANLFLGPTEIAVR